MVETHWKSALPMRYRRADGKWVSEEIPLEIWQAQRLVTEWMEKSDVIQLGKLRMYPEHKPVAVREET